MRHDPTHLETLASAAQAGDREALAALWEMALPLTRAHALRALARLRRGEVPFYDADDLMQDLYLDFHCWLMAAPAGGEYDILQRWAYRLPTALGSILRRPPLRLGGPHREQPLEPPTEEGGERDKELPGRTPDPVQVLVRRERVERLRTALACLDPRERRLLWLRYGREATAREIATSLGLEPGKVHQHLRAARERLWRAWGEAQAAWRG